VSRREECGQAGGTIDALTAAVRRYWNARIHDLDMTEHPPGTLGFFDDLEAYRYEKLEYLPRVVAFDGYAGRRVLEIGCGIGTDLLRFARGGAVTIGVDLAETAIRLARENFVRHGVSGANRLLVGDGAALPIGDATVDVVYAHGVLQYAAHPRGLVEETQRVLKPGGEAIFMVYNRRSWLIALSRVMRVALEHEDAPVLRLYSRTEFRRLLDGFTSVKIVPERFPVRSRLHRGWKGAVYNGVFVRAFNWLPRRLVRPLGWHLMAWARK
jgi:ubiquinone/menaquinone biosynthesis C-methylase UbiE